MQRLFTLILTAMLLSHSICTAQTQLEFRYGNGLLFKTSEISNNSVQNAYIDHGYTEFQILGLNTQIKGFFWLKNEVAISSSAASINYSPIGQTPGFPSSIRHRVNEVSYAVLPEFRYEFADAANFSAGLFINAGPGYLIELSNSHHPHFPSNASRIGVIANVGIIAQLGRIGVTFQGGYKRHKPGLFTTQSIPQHVWHIFNTSTGLVYIF